MKTFHFGYPLAGLALVSLLSGCGEAVDQGGQDPGVVPQIASETKVAPPVRGGPRVMPLQTGLKTTAATNAKLVYWGGHVLSNVKVYAVFWTGAVRAETQAKIGDFFTAVTQNPYIDWLTEYNTSLNADNGMPGTNQTIGRGSFGGTITIAPSVTSTTLTNDQIAAELNHQIDTGALPSPDENSLYMFFFPAGYSIDLMGQKSCTAFCAYHNTVVRAGQSVYYGVMPDVGADGCQLGCGFDTSVFNNLTVATSHELIESITDAEVGLATTNGPPLAWYDQSSGEIGDICAGVADTLPGTSFRVQKEWSNNCRACITVPSASCGTDSTPQIGLTSPGNGDTVSGTITVRASVSDRADAITKVSFTLNLFVPIGTATKPPYQVKLNTSSLKAGTYILSAKATDKSGKTGNASWITFKK